MTDTGQQELPAETGDLPAGDHNRPGSGIPAFWFPLLAAPVAMGSNAPSLLLPAMGTDLEMTVPSVTWLVTVFGLGLAIGNPLAGHLIRRRGLRTALALSTLLLLLGSAVVVVAPDFALIIAGRLLQAFGGTGLLVVAISVAGTAGRTGLVTAGAGLGGAAGPLAGSAVAAVSSWHVSLALSALSVVAIPSIARHLPRSERPSVKSDQFDVLGAILLILLTSALVLITHFAVAGISAAVLAAVLLAAWIRHRPEGFVPRALLGSRRFLGSCLLALVLATSYFVLLYRVPFLLHTKAGWDNTLIGSVQLIVLVIGSVLSLALSTSSERIGRRRTVIVLVSVAVVAQVLALLAVMTPVLPAVALGLAVTASAGGQATLLIAGTSALPAQRRAVAIGLYTLCFQLGGAFGPMIAALLSSN
jgi:predicted MFS family arabinose efflux permease